MTKDDVLKLLEEVTAPISRIEEKIGMPKGTLQRVVAGDRELPKEWALKFSNFIQRKDYIGLKRKPRKIELKNLNKQSEGTTQNVKPADTTNTAIDTTKPKFKSKLEQAMWEVEQENLKSKPK